MSKKEANLNEISLIWEHRSRIVALETNYKHISDTVEKIDKNVNSITEDHLPKLRESINNNKWTVGLVVGIGSVVGSAIVSGLVGKFFS